MTEQIQKEIGEQTTLKCLLNLMESTGWDVEKAMDALMITDRSLYRRSVEYALLKESIG